MKKMFSIGILGLAAGTMMFLAGCATEPIKVDYVMPAKAIANVKAVDKVTIKSTAKVTGNLAGDNKLNAGLVKQLLAMRLYKEGFYQVVDDISGDSEGASKLEAMLQEKDAGHGYATIMAGNQNDAKADITLDLEMSLDSNPVKKEIPFRLETINYKQVTDKKSGAPRGEPTIPVVEKVKKPVTIYEIVAKGKLKVMLRGRKDPITYSCEFEIRMPEADQFDSAQPSQLKALAAAVTPAINGIISDISPYKETRDLVAIKGGDERVVLLLNAKAFPEVVTVVEELQVTRKANFADLENMGIAFEAMGDLLSARDAFKAAEDVNPESETAKAGTQRVKDALAGKDAVKESGAERNKDTKFKK